MNVQGGQPSVAVIVTARRGVRLAPGCLAAIYAQEGPFCLIDVFLVGAVEAHIGDPQLAAWPHLTIIPQTNSAAARNMALRSTEANWAAFTDADCTPAPDWLARLLTGVNQAEAIGGKGTYATRQKRALAQFGQLEYEDKYDRLRSRTRIDFVDLYSAVYRRDVLLANGGFDENFPFLEDRELAFRLTARGYPLAFVPAALVYHPHAPNLRAYARSKFDTGYWNAQVVRRFPGQGIADAHTPQVIKLQMVLIGLLPVAAAAGWWFEGGRLAAAVCLGLFLASTAPFVGRCWQRAPRLALAAPLWLTVRAAALLAGYSWGVIRPKPGIVNTQATIGGVNYIAKRGLDIVGGFIGLLWLILLTPFISLAIKLESPGPVFFKQERIGQGGQPFIIFKFRSMRANAEQELDQLIDLDALEQPAFKIKDDPRVTRIGRFLRRSSLDELPQFWNVLRGDMSLVGPRPEETRLVARYSAWHRRRLAVKPGLSGPMQIAGRGDLTLDERVRLEIDYIEHYSLGRDLAILWRTLPAVIRGDGAH